MATPGVKQTHEQVESDAPLTPSMQRPYRAVAARANYLAADRPDLHFAAKEVCRWMSSPTEQGLKALKRLGRYLEGRRRLVYSYPWQTCQSLEVYSDTDWAGCVRTRKSTSGGCVVLGKHLIKSWSSTQTSISLSSGEAEFYGVVKASGVGLGMQSLLSDMRLDLPVRVWTDSTATMGICGRQGLGKLRHIDTQCLWIQQRVRDKTVELRKVRGDSNPADIFTKHLIGPEKVTGLLALFGCSFRDGRAASAPALRTGAGHESRALLSVEQQMPHLRLCSHDGRSFPAQDYEGMVVPDAYEHGLDVLPHELPDVDARFPRALAADPRGDEDPIEDDSLEKRGVAIGGGYSGRRRGAAQDSDAQASSAPEAKGESDESLMHNELTLHCTALYI